jgi:Lrp/AsnC family transcriptional regulator
MFCMKLDRIDRQLLSLLQEDASLSNADLADKVNLSPNACWRRVRLMEEAGIIRKRVALLSEDRVGLGVTVFVSIRTSNHTEEWLKKFAQGVRDMPEVIEFFRLSGEIDYLLKVVVRDIQDYDRVYKKLIAIAPLNDVSSSFAMERIKSSTALPLGNLR